MPELKELDIRGLKVKVVVTQNGQFQATLGKDTEQYTYSDSTLNGLEEKLMKATATRPTLDVRFTWTGRNRAGVPGHIYRKHADGRGYMVETAGKKEREDYYSLTKVMVPLTEAEAEAYRALLADQEAADKARAEFEKNHLFDAHEAAEKQAAGEE